MTREEMIKSICEEFINRSIVNQSDEYSRHYVCVYCLNCDEVAEDINHDDDCPVKLAEELLYQRCENCKDGETCGANGYCFDCGKCNCSECRFYDKFQPKD
jgi:hypothetical protein